MTNIPLPRRSKTAWRAGITARQASGSATNLKLFPWFQFCRNLMFWQAVWFLFFQDQLSAAEAILLIAIYDIGTSFLEVPSGYLSDRIGRRTTLIIAMVCLIAGSALLATGSGFAVFAVAQVLLGAGTAFASGTDSALLYDSLLDEGREHQVAEYELRAWRASFTALAVSALGGGLLAAVTPTLTYAATVAAAIAGLVMALRFHEPSRSRSAANAPLKSQLRLLFGYLRNRSLMWLFVLTMAMYVFSHVPFVFGQPFIAQSLASVGLETQTFVVSGAVVATMMLISVAVSLRAARLEQLIGRGRVFLLALAMQIALIGVLAVTVHPAAIALLLLRMVPDAIARPFILASIQPQLHSTNRATYLSLQSLCARVTFSAALFTTSLGTTQVGALSPDALQAVLAWYLIAGCVVLLILAVSLPYSGLGKPSHEKRSGGLGQGRHSVVCS